MSLQNKPNNNPDITQTKKDNLFLSFSTPSLRYIKNFILLLCFLLFSKPTNLKTENISQLTSDQTVIDLIKQVNYACKNTIDLYKHHSSQAYLWLNECEKQHYFLISAWPELFSEGNNEDCKTIIKNLMKQYTEKNNPFSQAQKKLKYGNKKD